MRVPKTCAVLIPFLQNQVCKMTLEVRPVEHADVAQCVGIRVASLGSLVIGRPHPYPGYVQEQEASLYNDLDGNNSHVRHLKVADTENEEEVMAYAKWEIYEKGRLDLDKLRQPIKQSDLEVDQFGRLREAAHEYFCRRNGEMSKHPHLRESILTQIVGKSLRSIFKLTFLTECWRSSLQLLNTGVRVPVACWSSGELIDLKRLLSLAIFRRRNREGACISTMDFKTSRRLNSIFRNMGWTASRK